MSADFDKAIQEILQVSIDLVKCSHGGTYPADALILSLCTRIYLAKTALDKEVSRLDWIASSYAEAGDLTPEQELKSLRSYERVYDAARKRGEPGKVAVRAAIDAAIAERPAIENQES